MFSLEGSDSLFENGHAGTIFKLLKEKVPRERWTEKLPLGWSFLHFVCLGKNIDACKALIAAGADVNAVALSEDDVHRITCIATTVQRNQPEMLELLITAGAVFDNALLEESFHLDSDECARVLIANGARLNLERIYSFPLQLISFQSGVLACRSAVVSLLRVRRAAKLWHWDKYLLAYVAHTVWATRYEENWSK